MTVELWEDIVRTHMWAHGSLRRDSRKWRRGHPKAGGTADGVKERQSSGHKTARGYSTDTDKGDTQFNLKPGSQRPQNSAFQQLPATPAFVLKGGRLGEQAKEWGPVSSLCAPVPPPLYTPSVLNKLWFSGLKWTAFIQWRNKCCSEEHSPGQLEGGGPRKSNS